MDLNVYDIKVITIKIYYSNGIISRGVLKQ